MSRTLYFLSLGLTLALGGTLALMTASALPHPFPAMLGAGLATVAGLFLVMVSPFANP